MVHCVLKVADKAWHGAMQGNKHPKFWTLLIYGVFLFLGATKLYRRYIRTMSWVTSGSGIRDHF